jgi:hypothetical protein
VGETRVPSSGATHLTLPALPAGPLPLPPQAGGEGQRLDEGSSAKKVEALGGTHYMDQAGDRAGGFEVKLYGPEGVLFDIAEHPWTGTEPLPVETAEAAEWGQNGISYSRRQRTAPRSVARVSPNR